jgi:uncharacterized protein
MRSIFADTGYWVALLHPRDELHQKAVQLAQATQSDRIVTSEMVLTELMNDFSKRGEKFRLAATSFIRDLKQSPNMTVLPQTSDLFDQALRLYEQRPDKDWSQTDCASFLLMRQYGITEALAYDKHFEQAGFVALLRSGPLKR